MGSFSGDAHPTPHDPPRTREFKRIVLLSGALASFEAARRTLAAHGPSNVRFWFFDTRIEDEDLCRFLNGIELALGVHVEKFADGRGPWQVFKDGRFIGSSRADVCSKHLKRRLLERQPASQYPTRRVLLVFGLDWTEPHRVEAGQQYWAAKGYRTEFPPLRRPFLLHNDYVEQAQSLGLSVPRLYLLGFPHNNCGGACIMADIRQWAHLLHHFPGRFLWHESNEQAMRKYLLRDVSILRNRNGGKMRPMALRFLRWRIRQADNGELPELKAPPDGCTCGEQSRFGAEIGTNLVGLRSVVAGTLLGRRATWRLPWDPSGDLTSSSQPHQGYHRD